MASHARSDGSRRRLARAARRGARGRAGARPRRALGDAPGARHLRPGAARVDPRRPRGTEPRRSGVSRATLPGVPAGAVPHMRAYPWQAGCALYATFGTAPAVDGDVDAPPASHETLVDMAIANGDEHAIKLTEACLREFALNPSPAYLA